MSSINGSTAAPPTSVPKPPFNEPSMEDILASIRRIIATDHYAVATPAPERPSVQPALPQDEHLPTAHAAVAEVVPPPQASVAAVAEDVEVYEAVPAGDAHHHDAEPVEGYAAAEDLHWDEPEEASQAAATIEAAPDLPPVTVDHAEDRRDGSSEADHGEDDRLLSAATGAVVSSTFQTLAESMLFQDPEMVERVTREAIRPLLKQWLDENLPTMVERLVRAEIERVARGGRNR